MVLKYFRPKSISLFWKVLFFLVLFQSIVLTGYALLAKRELDQRLISEKVNFKQTAEIYLKNAIDEHAEIVKDIVYKIAVKQHNNPRMIIEKIKQDWPNFMVDLGATGTALINHKKEKQFEYGNIDYTLIDRHVSSSLLSGMPEHYVVCNNDCQINIVIPLEYRQRDLSLIVSTSMINPIIQFQQVLDLKSAIVNSKSRVTATHLKELSWLDSQFLMLRKDANQFFYQVLKQGSVKSSFSEMLKTGIVAKFEEEHYFIGAFQIPFDVTQQSYFVIFDDISQTMALDQSFNRTFISFSLATMMVLSIVVLVVLYKPITRIKKLREYLPSLARGKEIKPYSSGQHSHLFIDEIDILEDSSNELANRLGLLNSKVNDRENALKKLAMFDGVTGLANRENFLTALERNLSLLTPTDSFIAIFFIDLDRFKQINDTLGHDVGDEVLKTVAKRLQNSIRSTDLVARLGGDEFTVLLNNLSSNQSILKIVKLILQNFEDPANIQNKMINIQLSIGITVVKDRNASITEIIKQADIAMYSAKGCKEKRFAFFKTEMETAILNQFTLLNDFPDALANNELALYYQPFYNIKDDKLYGFECLIRWEHAIRGVIPPDQFLNVLKDTEYMNQLEHWILEQAFVCCEQLCLISDQSLVFSINLSADMFLSPDLIKKISHLLLSYQIQPENIYIEIVEDSLLKDIEAAIYRIREIQSLGIRVSLDDFGVGYSSLNYLRKLPADNVKIDRSFVNEISFDETNQKLLASLIKLLINIDKTVTAEGIETQEQLTWLKAQGCHVGQGYFFSKPLPFNKAYELIKSEFENIHYLNFNK